MSDRVLRVLVVGGGSRELLDDLDAHRAITLVRLEPEHARELLSADDGMFDAVVQFTPSDGDAARELATLHATGYRGPAVLIGGGDRAGRLACLRAGADDVLEADVDAEELVVRLEVIVRRSRSIPRLRLGDTTIDCVRRFLRRGDRRVQLTPKEFELLLGLIEAPGAMASRADLLKRIWNFDLDPGTPILEVLVSRLRRKVESVAAARIERVGAGSYRLELGQARQAS